MAIIKSYTDLQQSKKLAEILPIKSANMKILPFTEREYRIVPINDISVCGREDEIYAWSLAALLAVLPYGYSSILTKSFNGKDYYCKIDGKPFESKADNSVDACYELILKLHELNLL